MSHYEKKGAPVKARQVSALPKSCPKCGNKVLDQNTGYLCPIDFCCHRCGLTSESRFYTKFTLSNGIIYSSSINL